LTTLITCLALQLLAWAEESYQPKLTAADLVEVYKSAGEKNLFVNIFEGQGESAEGKRPAIVFFFGGGWAKGSPGQFEKQARFFAEQGYTVLLPDYRVSKRDGTKVSDAVEDAADAYRWLVKNAERLGIDPSRIVLAGGSEGGYLALSIPLLHPDLPLPVALVAYNPVTRTTPGGLYKPGAFRELADTAKFSLEDKVRADLPPLLVLHGDADKTVPYSNSQDFVAAWQAAGNAATLITYPGSGHGFFNGGASYDKSVAETLDFLKNLSSKATPPVAAAKVAGTRPNIVLILADDLGYSDPGFLGGDIQTPHLDRLAKEGTVFGRFINHAKCEPSRASLITGVHFQRQTTDHVTREFRNVTTIAEQLRRAGYRTFSTGKWHLPGKPTEHGFDRFFGLRGGASNHFDPLGQLKLGQEMYIGGDLLLDDKDFRDYGKDFYTTDAFTDYALKFIQETPAGQPFFLYLAYTAPHWPLQAPPETIAKYKGRYDKGWDALREERFAHMKNAGLLPKGWQLPPMPESLKPWSQTIDPQAKAQLMEVHAAMVDRMDQGIGRVLQELEKDGRLENTLILFASDNGAIGAIAKEARFDRTPDRPAGAVDSFRMLPEGFTYAVNTPWRGQKLTHLAGGDTSPLIVHWPGKVPTGVFSWEPINILDLMPTLLSVSGATYPSDLLPLDGRDVSSLLANPSESTGEETPQFLRLVFSEADEHGILQGRWKAYRSEKDAWELYDLANDGTETQDLGAQNPEKLKDLTEKFTTFENQVLQKP
jgi:arylsulfatase